MESQTGAAKCSASENSPQYSEIWKTNVEAIQVLDGEACISNLSSKKNLYPDDICHVDKNSPSRNPSRDAKVNVSGEGNHEQGAALVASGG
jgi:hypothetical protein